MPSIFREGARAGLAVIALVAACNDSGEFVAADHGAAGDAAAGQATGDAAGSAGANAGGSVAGGNAGSSAAGSEPGGDGGTNPGGSVPGGSSGANAGGRATGGDPGGGNRGGGAAGAGRGGAMAGAGGSEPSGGSSGVDCDCVVGAYVPVCGIDAVTYDAACGRACVPVQIACDGPCPCPDKDGGAGGQGGSCPEDCAVQGLLCCDGRCVNPQNDIHNCGACNTQCTGDAPYCNLGECTQPPCDSTVVCGSGQTCCASSCCSEGELCCLLMQGPWFTSCVQPVDGTCPVGNPQAVCAAPNTPIATPRGERPIAELKVGDLVYTVDGGGIVVAPLLITRQRPARHHRVQRVKLATGRILEISSPHPTLDGRSFGELAAGDELDGVEVLAVDQIPYRHALTYDILPDSESGAYFAAGVAIGSTLKRPQ